MKAEADCAAPRGPGLLPRVTDGDTEALRGGPPHSGAAPPRGPALSQRRPSCMSRTAGCLGSAECGVGLAGVQGGFICRRLTVG